MRACSKYQLCWPDDDEAPEVGIAHMMMRVTDCDVVTKHVRTKGIAVQAGCHIGLWARRLAQHFVQVHTFEPTPVLYECAEHNLAHCPNVVLSSLALGAVAADIHMQHRWGGKSKVTQATSGELVVPAKQITIDSLQLPRCDLIYLDIEGYEPEALAGAHATIMRCRPVVAVEVLKGNDASINAWADALSYTRVETIHSDWIFAPC